MVQKVFFRPCVAIGGRYDLGVFHLGVFHLS
jgi:hypothetical protein